MRFAELPGRRTSYGGVDRQPPGPRRCGVPPLGGARRLADARCVYANAGRHQSVDAREHAGTRWHRLSSSRLDAENSACRLFRADDQPDLLARTGACGAPNSGSDDAADDGRRATRCPRATARRCMMRRFAMVLAVALFGFVFASLTVHHVERQSLPPLAKRYVELVPQELGAPNVITGILLTYRAFDTLGEVAVLFMVAAGVGLVLGSRARRNENAPSDTPPSSRQASEIVRTGTQILVPLIAIFAAYIITNGHLSAGGGFQGGAVAASSAILLLLADPRQQFAQHFLS